MQETADGAPQPLRQVRFISGSVRESGKLRGQPN